MEFDTLTTFTLRHLKVYIPGWVKEKHPKEEVLNGLQILYLFQGVIKVTPTDNLFVEHRNMFFFFYLQRLVI